MDDTINTVIGDVCANNGALLHYAIMLVLGVPVFASAVANGRNRMPGWAVWILDKMALNFVKGEAEKAAQMQNPHNKG